METAVRRFVQLLDSGERNRNGMGSAIIKISRLAEGPPDAAAVSAATVQRLLHHMHLPYVPEEDARAITYRVERAFDAAVVLTSMSAQPLAALQTPAVMWGLLDALVAEGAVAWAYQQAGLRPETDKMPEVRTAILEVLNRILDSGARAGPDEFPEEAALPEGLLRPGVMTALLKAAVWWSETAAAPGNVLLWSRTHGDPLYMLVTGFRSLQERQPPLEQERWSLILEGDPYYQY